jgi:hypothetical protein
MDLMTYVVMPNVPFYFPSFLTTDFPTQIGLTYVPISVYCIGQDLSSKRNL